MNKELYEKYQRGDITLNQLLESIHYSDQFNPKEAAIDAVRDFCEDGGPNRESLDTPWKAWESSYGEITTDQKELLNLIQGAIEYGISYALIKLDDQSYDSANESV